MCLIKNNILIVLLIGFSFSFTQAQEKSEELLLPPLPLTEDTECGLINDLLLFEVSVVSNENNYIKGLNHKDFNIYIKGEKQTIVYFSKSKLLSNQNKKNVSQVKQEFKYIIGINNTWNINEKSKVDITLSEEVKKEHGAVYVTLHKQEYRIL